MLLNTKLNKILKIEFKSTNKIRTGTGTVNLNKPILYRELEPVQEPNYKHVMVHFTDSSVPVSVRYQFLIMGEYINTNFKKEIQNVYHDLKQNCFVLSKRVLLLI